MNIFVILIKNVITDKEQKMLHNYKEIIAQGVSHIRKTSSPE